MKREEKTEKKHKKEEKFPYIADPDVQQITYQPDHDCAIVSRYSACNCEATQDATHIFHDVAPSYPSAIPTHGTHDMQPPVS